MPRPNYYQCSPPTALWSQVWPEIWAGHLPGPPELWSKARLVDMVTLYCRWWMLIYLVWTYFNESFLLCLYVELHHTYQSHQSSGLPPWSHLIYWIKSVTSHQPPVTSHQHEPLACSDNLFSTPPSCPTLSTNHITTLSRHCTYWKAQHFCE